MARPVRQSFTLPAYTGGGVVDLNPPYEVDTSRRSRVVLYVDGAEFATFIHEGSMKQNYYTWQGEPPLGAAIQVTWEYL